MQFSISSEKLAEVFPAFFIVDQAGHILDFGPAIARHLPSIQTGDPIEAHFTGIAGVATGNSDALAHKLGRTLELHSVENGLILTGAIIPDAGRYLLALNLATASLNVASVTGHNLPTALQISDFTPGDATVDVLLLVQIQQALLHDAEALATSLERERRRNEGLVERITRLAGFLAHDINNILSVIALSAERIASLEPGNHQTKRIATIIAETADRGSGITRSFMAISREGTEKCTPQSADELINQQAGFFSAIVGSEIILSTNLCAATARINVAAGDFVNCLTNLLINCRDAIATSGSIEIATRVLPASASKPAERLEITVSDNGAGMTDDILQKVFEPFFSTKERGNGLGLPAVAEYLSDCGGDVLVESSPGFGTKVSLNFPLVAPASISCAYDISDCESTLVTNPPQPTPEVPIVLVVEDEPYALEALVEMLEDEGFEVWPAGSAEEATAKLDAEISRSKKPDILLTDVILPRITGIELAKAATSKTPSLKVILMSGFVPEADAIREGWLFAAKPLNSEKLLHLLRSPTKLAEEIGGSS